MKEDCIFCQIASGKVSSDLVYMDEHTVAFNDINPEAPIHILIVPKQHIATLGEIKSSKTSLLGEMLLVASRLAKEKGFAEKGYRLVINIGHEAGQTIDHLHIHLLAGRYLAWPPG